MKRPKQLPFFKAIRLRQISVPRQSLMPNIAPNAIFAEGDKKATTRPTPMLTRILNTIWLNNQRRTANTFWQEAEHWPQVQERKLMQYLRTHANTAFGKEHGFSQITNYQGFVQRVPIIEDWATFQPWIDRIEQGEQEILTAAQVKVLEETSGTTGFSKRIPYPTEFKAEFEAAVAIWLTALADLCPKAFYGKAYWSLSPALKPRRKTSGGLQIGIEDDTEYFSWWQRQIVRHVLVKPHIAGITAAEPFYDAVAKELLKQADNLSFLSVWSPVFFLKLDEAVCRCTGTDNLWSETFPRLACVSCWTDAQAAIWIPQVRNRLGRVQLQGKGLLSTEGVTTIPINLTGDAVLAYQSHFYEFREAATGVLVPASGLQTNQVYEVILTNSAGLYRYATRDLVRCTGHHPSGLPFLKFEGRAGNQSDLVGEKLSEPQVIAALRQSGLLGRVEQAYLLPTAEKEYAHYVLLTFGKEYADLSDQLVEFENALCANPYYAQARAAGQLDALVHRKAQSDPLAQIRLYLAGQKQMREGDMKIPVLIGLQAQKEFGLC